jgi:spore coat polysaccharide biosynthesis protein SpsF
MMDSTAIVLQARLGSSRLPRKALAPIGPRSLLGHCLIRLAAARLPIIVATTTSTEDDAIEIEARAYGADVFRGHAHDVLARYLAAADAFGLADIVRATGDNPFVDAGGPLRVIEFRRRFDADHVTERGLPVGMAVEAVSIDALRRASTLIVDPYDREHVTSFVRRDRRFRAVCTMAPGHIRRPGLRLTVDTMADLEFARGVHALLDSNEDPPTTPQVIRAASSLLAAQRHPPQKIYATR